jgi:tetratricopeptide (TPR) repeat protein
MTFYSEVPLKKTVSLKIAGLVFLLLTALAPWQQGLYSWPGDGAAFEIAKKDFIRGLAHYNRMQYLAAVEFFRKALARHPDYYTAREYLARSYKLAGFSQEARREWAGLLESTPENAAVQARIETLKFRESNRRLGDISRDIVYVNALRSRDYPRFGFSKPVDIAIDENKSLYITSFDTGKLVVIGSDGAGERVIKPSLSGRLYGVDVQRDRVALSNFSDDRVLIWTKRARL